MKIPFSALFQRVCFFENSRFYLLSHKRPAVFAIFLLLSCAFVQAQSKVTLSGYIKDAKDGEAVIGASVYVPALEAGAVSNIYGFYSLSLPSGEYEILFRYLGYETVKQTLVLTQNTELNIELSESQSELEEVVISGEKQDANVSNVEMSVNKLDINIIKKMPALLGEIDVVRSIQLLPGVSTVGEGATGFNVRGGGVGENLILLDDAPVYNSSHLFGFFSVFNPDAVSNVKLVKGGVPAQYGGRLSSVLDIRMKEGNNKKLEVNGGIGAIFSRLSIEAPIIKDKASFIVAGRRSYIDVLAKPFLSENLRGSEFNFYDLTVKANYNINSKNRVFLSGYLGRDVFSAENAFSSNWGNATATLRWNSVLSNRWFFNLVSFYSNYDYSLRFGAGAVDRFTWSSRIINYSVRPEFTFYLNPSNTITFGVQGIYHNFQPGSATGISNSEITDISLPNKYAVEGSFYVGNEQTLNTRLSLLYGLRWSYFNYLGAGTAYEFAPNPENPAGRKIPISQKKYDDNESIRSYQNWEPRFAVKYQLSPQSSIKASYNRMVQYIHLLSNTVAATPLDLWAPSTNNIRPEIADQFALGYFKNFKDNMWETSVEVYYKDYQNVIDYIDNADLLLNTFIEGDLLSGIGRAYGAEFYVRKTSGKFNGWISYTLARTERKIVGLNGGDWFPNRFDQTHNLSATLFYDLNERWSFSSNFVLVSGTPATFPTNRINFQGYVIPQNPDERRNNFRVPTYHRLDISATRYGKKYKKNGEVRKTESFWVYSVYNLYARRNPFSLVFQPNPNNAQQTQAVRFSVIGSLIPSVSYNFKF